jgi:hypothetical protein
VVDSVTTKEDDVDTMREEAGKIKEDAKVVVKDIRVMAENLVKTVRDLIHEGNVRKITVKNKDGEIIAIFPLSVGVAGILAAPLLAAMGALSAVLVELTLTVERRE